MIQNIQIIKDWFFKEETASITEKEEIGITVIIDNVKVSVKLNDQDKLNEIRKILENVNVIKMTDDINFTTDGEVIIDIESEEKYKLEEILVETNRIHLKKRANWRELEEKFKLGYGRNYEENRDKAADKKAFIIKDCEFNVFTLDDYHYGTKTISSADELVRNKSLFLEAQVDIQSVKLGLSVQSENISQKHSETSSTVQFKNIGKAEISIREQTIEPTKEFINAVQKAIDLKDPIIINKIIEEFGQFIPTIVRFGGRFYYEDITHMTKNSENKNKAGSATFGIYGQDLDIKYESGLNSGSENTMQRQYSFIFGGDKIKIYEGKEEEWLSSLQEFKYWEPIEFRKPVSIFELLDKNLKEELKKIIGKRIIYSNIQDYKFKINSLRNHVADLEMLPKDIEKIFHNPDIDPQIFAAILNMEENNDIFTYTLYTPKPYCVPKIIINCIQPNCEEQKECYIKIGWIVVGYNPGFNSAHSNFDIRFQSTKKEVSVPSNRGDVFKVSENNLLIACGAPVVFDLDLVCKHFEHLVIGHHFSQCKNTKKTFTCLYGYDLHEKKYSTLPNFEFNLLSFIDYPRSELFDQFKVDRKQYQKKSLFPNFKKIKSKKQEKQEIVNKFPEFVSLYADNNRECLQCYPEFIAKKLDHFILEQPKCKNTINKRLDGYCFASVFNLE
ncbi:45618_t:CDS:1, partial [Gigaspora margarita]